MIVEQLVRLGRGFPRLWSRAKATKQASKNLTTKKQGEPRGTTKDTGIAPRAVFDRASARSARILIPSWSSVLLRGKNLACLPSIAHSDPIGRTRAKSGQIENHQGCCCDSRQALRSRIIARDHGQLLAFDAAGLTAPPAVRSNWEPLYPLRSLAPDHPNPVNREAYRHYNIPY